ncbi:unnamed protein product [Prorocentrum cordatum]|uniref:Uncharacterized protein n=1 Tax=Prorocentrum cordatum TaxID=2364126 RepID=A0ABN9XRE5_9DINO|nr:unnamed protein product [Polarella glacialis]
MSCQFSHPVPRCSTVFRTAPFPWERKPWPRGAACIAHDAASAASPSSPNTGFQHPQACRARLPSGAGSNGPPAREICSSRQSSGTAPAWRGAAPRSLLPRRRSIPRPFLGLREPLSLTSTLSQSAKDLTYAA